jgi:hypothetical protein
VSLTALITERITSEMKMESFISDAKAWMAHSLGASLLSGALGSSTWLYLLYVKSPLVRELLQQHPHITLSLCVQASGWLFVGIGSMIEDLLFKKKEEAQKDIELLYLRTVFKIEPYGLKRIHALEARLKCELGAFVGSSFALIGALFLANTIDGCSFLIWALSVLAFLLAHLARFHHGRVSEMQAELLKGIVEAPQSPSLPPL